MDGYQVAPEALTRFAALGQEQGASLADAGTVLDQARLPGTAFGRSRAAAELTRAYERCLADHVDVLAGAGSTVRETADAVRGAADAYSGADEAAANRLGGGLDPYRA